MGFVFLVWSARREHLCAVVPEGHLRALCPLRHCVTTIPLFGEGLKSRSQYRCSTSQPAITPLGRDMQCPDFIHYAVDSACPSAVHARRILRRGRVFLMGVHFSGLEASTYLPTFAWHIGSVPIAHRRVSRTSSTLILFCRNDTCRWSARRVLRSIACYVGGTVRHRRHGLTYQSLSLQPESRVPNVAAALHTSRFGSYSHTHTYGRKIRGAHTSGTRVVSVSEHIIAVGLRMMARPRD